MDIFLMSVFLILGPMNVLFAYGALKYSKGTYDNIRGTGHLLIGLGMIFGLILELCK